MKQRRIISAMLALVFIVGNFLIAAPAFADGETATKINVNQDYQGSLQYNDKYYSFTLTNDGNVILSMQRNAKSSWNVELTDLNGNTLESFNTSYGTMVSGNEERQVGLPKGTYLVRISNYTNGNASSYKFRVKYTQASTYEKEFNNSLETANKIQLNTLNKGVIQDYGDKDYYVFTTPSDGNVTLSMNRNTKCSWNMKLYSANGRGGLNGMED